MEVGEGQQQSVGSAYALVLVGGVSVAGAFSRSLKEPREKLLNSFWFFHVIQSKVQNNASYGYTYGACVCATAAVQICQETALSPPDKTAIFALTYLSRHRSTRYWCGASGPEPLTAHFFCLA